MPSIILPVFFLWRGALQRDIQMLRLLNQGVGGVGVTNYAFIISLLIISILPNIEAFSFSLFFSLSPLYHPNSFFLFLWVCKLINIFVTSCLKSYYRNKLLEKNENTQNCIIRIRFRIRNIPFLMKIKCLVIFHSMRIHEYSFNMDHVTLPHHPEVSTIVLCLLLLVLVLRCMTCLLSGCTERQQQIWPSHCFLQAPFCLFTLPSEKNFSKVWARIGNISSIY